jgi:hypothetical protein
LKRWFQYEEPSGWSARVTLQCPLCRDFVDFAKASKIERALSQNFQFRTTSLRAMIAHDRREHIPDFVNLESFWRQTVIWRNEYILRQPGPYFVNYPQIGELPRYLNGMGSLTS